MSTTTSSSAASSSPTSAGAPLRLLEPMRLGPLSLRNRLVMASMHTGAEDAPQSAPQLAAFLAERARGGAGLIVTGGLSPSPEGVLTPQARVLDAELAAAHRQVTAAVHAEGGVVIAQLLHAGRYAAIPEAVSASASHAPISPFPARELTGAEVERTIEDFARAAQHAIEAGYDGVEVMGSEGYLLNQFLAPRTNHREDAWGGDAVGRRRFAVETVRAVRAAIGPDHLLSVRISVLDLVEDGQTWEETSALARDLEAVGADVLTTGVGWHESRVPTILTSVPRGAFLGMSARLRAEVGIPVIAANRLHDPAQAERALREGAADLIAMARPLLADAQLPAKLAAGRADLIAPCIACNQACLDRAFAGKPAGCLMDPRAGRETVLPLPTPRTASGLASGAEPGPTPRRRRRVDVVGGGVAGMQAALVAAQRGHAVVLWEAAHELGGQFRWAAEVPGKEDYARAIDSWRARLAEAGVQVRLGREATTDDVVGADHVIVATGVRPRALDLPGFPGPDGLVEAEGAGASGDGAEVSGDGAVGADGARVGEADGARVGGADGAETAGPQVLSYAQWFALRHAGRAPQARRVAVIGAGGIGVDVAVALTAPSNPPLTSSVEAWRRHWGVGDPAAHRGGITAAPPHHPSTEVHLLQRRTTRIGADLGLTSGWVHRAELRRAGVITHTGVEYLGAEPGGLRIREDGVETVLAVDLVIVCAGQESQTALAEKLRTLRDEDSISVVGGARMAGELDAERAIREGHEAALALV